MINETSTLTISDELASEETQNLEYSFEIEEEEYEFEGLTKQEKRQLLQQFYLRLIDANKNDLETEIFHIGDRIKVYKKRINSIPLATRTESGAISKRDRHFLLELLEDFMTKSISHTERLRALEILQIVDSESLWNYM